MNIYFRNNKKMNCCVMRQNNENQCLDDDKSHRNSLSLYVLLRLCVQNRRKKWNFPPNFRNGIIWTAPFPLNIRNGIIWGGAFSKAFRSSEALISVLSKNATCALGLQKHLFRYSLKMPACALGLQKHLFRYSLKMPACALRLQKHLFRYSLKMPACMIIFKILFSQKTLHIVLIFKWSRLDTNLWIWNLCICQKTCQQNTNIW